MIGVVRIRRYTQIFSEKQVPKASDMGESAWLESGYKPMKAGVVRKKIYAEMTE